MSNVYVDALADSLEKKVDILNQIHELDKEQYRLINEETFEVKAIDENFEKKSALIARLNSLDDGFETVYAKVKDEIAANKDQYASQIRRMQDLITKITELSTTIQAEEARNKAGMETAFRREKDKIKQQRSGIKAVASYTQAMRGFPLN